MTGDISLTDLHDESRVSSELQGALRETVFSSGLNISPRRLNEIARVITRTFFEYLSKVDDAEIANLGLRLAEDGLAPKSVVAVTNRLRYVTESVSNPVEPLSRQTTSFCTVLLVGYMEQRERIILREAERTHRAYLAAIGI